MTHTHTQGAAHSGARTWGRGGWRLRRLPWGSRGRPRGRRGGPGGGWPCSSCLAVGRAAAVRLVWACSSCLAVNGAVVRPAAAAQHAARVAPQRWASRNWLPDRASRTWLANSGSAQGGQLATQEATEAAHCAAPLGATRCYSALLGTTRLDVWHSAQAGGGAHEQDREWPADVERVTVTRGLGGDHGHALKLSWRP